jgi:chromosome segregation ATPase
VELCEIADAGAKALFEVLQDSKSIRKVTVKNNLIRDGICIQKAVATNSQLYVLNVDYNDIPFKVFSEIQKQVAINYRAWKSGQENKTEEELESMQQTHADLHTCREAIVVERQIVQQKADQAAALRAELQRLEEAKQAHLAQLDQAVADITKQANDTYAGFREETDRQGATVAAVETELAQTQLKLAREIERFRVEVKSLSTTERSIAETRVSNEQVLEAIAQRRVEAKDKYRTAVAMLESSFQIAKMPPMEDLIDSAADGKKGKGKSKSKAKAKAKAKGKGKGKGKNKVSATAEKPETPKSGASDKPPEENSAP